MQNFFCIQKRFYIKTNSTKVLKLYRFFPKINYFFPLPHKIDDLVYNLHKKNNRKGVIKMHKKNVLKTIVCGLAITIAAGSAVLAGTSSYALTSVQNTTSSTCYYRLRVSCYDYSELAETKISCKSVKLEPGRYSSVSVSRTISGFTIDYRHHVQSAVSESFSSGTTIDTYDMVAMQYYR